MNRLRVSVGTTGAIDIYSQATFMQRVLLSLSKSTFTNLSNKLLVLLFLR